MALGDAGSAARTEVDIKTNTTTKHILFMSSPPFFLKSIIPHFRMESKTLAESSGHGVVCFETRKLAPRFVGNKKILAPIRGKD
jgi:hypothetical protein